MSALGSLVVRLALDHAEYVQGLDRSSQEALKFAQSAQRSFDVAGASTREFFIGAVKGAAGAAAAFMSVSAVLTSLNKSIDDLDALNDLKDATGSSIENLSALEDVAKRTGATMDTVGSILVKFNDQLKNADGENGASIALQRIGLDAEKLKQIDPAEALRQTAVALAGYANDGDKARMVQELFGKSVKDAAPFLNDLAEQTSLVAKVTAEQTEQAEAYNKHLAAMSTNIDGVSRSIVNNLLPALNDAFDRFNRARNAGQGFGESLARMFGVGSEKLANPYESLAKANAEIAKIEANLGKNKHSSKERLEALKRDAAEYQLAVDEIESKLNAPSTNGETPKIGVVNYAPKTPKKDKASKTKDDTSERQRAYAESLKADAEFMAEVWELFNQSTLATGEAAEAYRDILDPSREIGREMERIDALVSAGALTPEEGAEAQIAKLKDAYKEAGDSVNALDEINKNLYKGMQDTIGDGFYEMMSGNFDKVGAGFGDMVKRMLAEAAAAKLMKTLFGDMDDQGGGGLGGLFGAIWGGLTASANGNAFSGGRVVPFANGGAFTNSIVSQPTLAPMALFGEAGDEAIMPLERDEAGRLGVRASGSGGKATTINFAPVYQISGALDEQRTRQIAMEAANSSSAQLVDTLTREGKIQR